MRCHLCFERFEKGQMRYWARCRVCPQPARLVDMISMHLLCETCFDAAAETYAGYVWVTCMWAGE
jgi:hypothetical protein